MSQQQHRENNSAKQHRHFIATNNGVNTISRKNNSGTSPISSSVNLTFPVNENTNLIAQQQYQQLFGNHMANQQQQHQKLVQYVQQPQMSVQYSNTIVPFNPTTTSTSATSSVMNVNNNMNIISENNSGNSSPTQSYFQSLPPEEFREIFLKKVFLGEDPPPNVVDSQTNNNNIAPLGNNNQHVILPNSSSPPNVYIQQQYTFYQKPNVQNNTSPITPPSCIIQQQPNNQFNPLIHASCEIPPQQVENLTEEQLMQYIMTWMANARTNQ